ncbi:hypothetical protein HMPREF0198_2461 [Cardiobacterium hominis ATCC 15826]|uniref:Uncharacterized protein n=1 Tax=Cardiobacterium hominis (strain ATCC 15826 / DSM 8339 / NCTC 10426 / 6573) TaxID=638300 RepID=C8ND83_CARH6|nr:hypothetical protein HMPREF0198_2461 [Cardiobacterium hominis ATCC 15826]
MEGWLKKYIKWLFLILVISLVGYTYCKSIKFRSIYAIYY